MPIDVDSWPLAPKAQRPKALYLCETLDESKKDVLKSKGWKPVDVRRLPNETDHQRADALKCFIEGVRLGTISPAKGQLGFLELEAKIYGLGSNKAPPSERQVLSDDAVEALRSIGLKSSTRSRQTQVQEASIEDSTAESALDLSDFE